LKNSQYADRTEGGIFLVDCKQEFVFGAAEFELAEGSKTNNAILLQEALLIKGLRI
jgi:GAF domain-containing protein